MSIIDFDSGNAKIKKTKTKNTDNESNEYYQDLFRQFQDSIFDDSYKKMMKKKSMTILSKPDMRQRMRKPENTSRKLLKLCLTTLMRFLPKQSLHAKVMKTYSISLK